MSVAAGSGRHGARVAVDGRSADGDIRCPWWTGPWGRALAGVEMVLAVVAVLRDLLLPTLVLLALAAVSLSVRRLPPSALGLVRVRRPARLAARVLGWTVAWTGLQLGLIMPVVEHLTGRRQDVADFARLHGDPWLLTVMLVLSWTLAAVGEEVAFRGYLLTRLRGLLPGNGAGTATAVLAAALLFGLIHTEQGVVGVVLTTVDALFLTALRYRYRTLWASVLGHGFNNTIGMVAFFLVGPVGALW